LQRLIPTTVKSNTRVFKVKSNTKEYIVELNESNYSCTCIGYNFRGKCKHITAVEEKQQFTKSP
jgi:predicted nucleic acid-binding Zn finger protein